jgi:cystathionine beta-lyase
MSFDTVIDRRGTDCAKWDMMEPLYGVSPDDGLAMWVADTDFQAPPVVQDALRAAVEHGVLGYVNCTESYHAAICWWMEHRHGWRVDPAAIFTTVGLVNGVGMCLDAFTDPGDEIVVFSPVYHAFARAIKAAGRKVVECELGLDDGRYVMDFDAYDAQMTGREKVVILCSPHNPGGRVWTRTELEDLAAFAQRHDLLLISDEIHHDLVFPGHTHIPMTKVDADIADRLIMLTAPSKTFNIAGLHTGNVIIPHTGLRATFDARMKAISLAGNSLGQIASRAAYSPEGAAWADEQVAYLDQNRKIFDQAVNALPGITSMTLDATYLAWVNFANTGLSRNDFTRRVEKDAKIAANYGTTFGKGGETYLRFNLGTQRARVEEACQRLTQAFSDLQ